MHSRMKDFALASSSQEADAILKIVSEIETRIYQHLDAIQKNILGSEGRMLARQIRQLFIDGEPIRQEVETLLESGGKKGTIRLITVKGADHVEKLKAKSLQLSAYARNKADTFMKSGEASQSRLERIVMGPLQGRFYL